MGQLKQVANFPFRRYFVTNEINLGAREDRYPGAPMNNSTSIHALKLKGI